MFIQLSATMTKLCHIKRDHPVHIIYSKCPPSAEPPKRMLGGRFGSQNTVNEPSFGFLHSTSRKTYLMTFSSNQARSYAVRKVAFQSLGGQFLHQLYILAMSLNNAADGDDKNIGTNIFTKKNMKFHTGFVSENVKFHGKFTDRFFLNFTESSHTFLKCCIYEFCQCKVIEYLQVTFWVFFCQAPLTSTYN